jgi:hypothetical protein
MGRGLDFGCVNKLSDGVIIISEKIELMETLRKKSTRILYPENKGYKMLSFMLRAYLSQRITATRGRPDMRKQIKFIPHPIKTQS